MGLCRFCKQPDSHAREQGTLLKYGVRHYAHVKCGLREKGPEFFDHFTVWQLSHTFPYLPVIEAGLQEEFAKRCDVKRLAVLKRQSAMLGGIGTGDKPWQVQAKDGVILARHATKTAALAAASAFKRAEGPQASGIRVCRVARSESRSRAPKP